MTRLSPFYTDDKTAKAILSAAKDHLGQPTDGQVTGAGTADVTTQFQNTCQFRLKTDWQAVKNSTQNFVASGEKLAPLQVGTEKRPYPTTIYAYGERPTTGKGSIIVATRRANRWVLLPTGTASEATPSNPRVRLVQPKELFPACEYKTLQDVYGAALEYSDDGQSWIPAYDLNIAGRDVLSCPNPDPSFAPHKYWRVNLKGFSKPENPNDPYADRGFYTFGRLWEALFWVERFVETKKTIDGTEYTFTVSVPNNWLINSSEPLPVDMTLTPAVSNGELFYRPNTGEWKSLGTFTGSGQVMIPSADLKDGRQQSADGVWNTSFQFKVEGDSEQTVDGRDEFGNLTLRRPTYTLSPERPDSFTLPEAPVVEESNGHQMSAKVTSLVQSSKTSVSVHISLDPPVLGGRLHYRSETGTWQDLGEIHQDKTVSIPSYDLDEEQNTFFEFVASQYDVDIVGLRVPKPTYPMISDAAEIAMHPPLASALPPAAFPWDSKPTPRKAQNHRYWVLTFDQPEVVMRIMLDVDRHHEHYIICPGGRDAFKQDISFVYSFDLASEKWTATTFPEMQKPMFNMDAKVVELSDKTHQLIVLSGQVSKGFSNIIQGYNFERDYIQNVVDIGEGGLNFAGRPALVGDPTLLPNGSVKESMVRNGYIVNRPDGEWDFSRSLIVVGGSERSCFIRGSSYPIDSVLFSIQGTTLAIGTPYETGTLNISFSNTGHTGLPFGFFDYKTYSSQAGAVGTRLKNIGMFARHQNLPVRGILRRRPLGNTSQASSSNPVVDFLLIGGFCIVGNEESNKRIVSGIFHSPTVSQSNSGQYSMLVQGDYYDPWVNHANNTYSHIFYPDCPYVLGDCCAEYIEDRDEVICFGGRSAESDTALAHDVLAVLQFNPNSNAAQWNTQKYPRLPHPRWSAASVLIKDLLRQGETVPCDRIFIIGGRNRDGFVAEVDVFNLRYNRWETDWKGLDQGELENYTAPGGGGGGTTIIVQNGGSDGIQSIRAGDNVIITGETKNPIISARLTWG